MLLILAPEANSEPSQAYKMGILAKIVNGLKLILKLMVCLYEDIKVRLAGTLGISDPSDPAVLKSKKSSLVLPFNHLDHDPLNSG